MSFFSYRLRPQYSRHDRSNGPLNPFSSSTRDMSTLLPALIRSKSGLSILLAVALFVVFVNPLRSQGSYLSSWGNGAVRVDGRGVEQLREKLADFLKRPVWEHEGLIYPSRQGCPMGTFSRDDYFFHQEKPDRWAAVTASEIRVKRRDLTQYFERLQAEGVPLVWTSDMLHPPFQITEPGIARRGIIYAAGNYKALRRLRASLHMLRNVVQSTLPIEIYYFPNELTAQGEKEGLENDFGDGVVLRQVENWHANGKNWQIKLSAFMRTEFTEFVWLDTDNLPLADPNDLFDTVEFKKSRAVFWSDLNKDHPANAIWRYLAQPCSDQHWPAETGQIVYDKRGNNGLNLAILHISNYFMEDPDWYGELMYGDKDTFRIAHYLLGLEYIMAPRVFASLGGYQVVGEDTAENCGHTMMHHGLTPVSQARNPKYHPRPAFAHMILTKHSPTWQVNKVFTHITRPILDGSADPSLVRVPARWTGPCFAWELQGPDGLQGTANSWDDGQGVVTMTVEDAFRDEKGVLRDQHIPKALKALQQEIVDINLMPDE